MGPIPRTPYPLRAGFFALLAILAAVFLREKLRSPRLEGRPLRQWIAELDRPSALRDPRTIEVLAHSPQHVLPELERRFSREDGPLRSALIRLSRGRWLPLRINAQDDFREAALQVLERMGSDALPMADALVAALPITRNPRTQMNLRKVLVNLGPSALPGVLDALATVSTQSVVRILPVLREIVERHSLEPGDGLSSVRAAVPYADHPDPAVAIEALRILHGRSEEARGVASILRSNLQGHSAPGVRQLSAELLGKLGVDPANSVAALRDSLGDRDPGVRSAAANALGRFGVQAAPAIPELVSLIRASSTGLTVACLNALGRIGPPASSAVGEIAPMLEHSLASIRATAALALGRIGAEGEVAVPALGTALSDEDPYVRHNAAFALARYGTIAAPAVPELIRALKDPVESVRIRAAEALGCIGAEARSATPFLEAARDNNQSVMSRPVRGALEQLGAAKEP